MATGIRKLTISEAAQGYAIRDLPSADVQPFSPYYDPRTGKVYNRLPADAWSVKHYQSRGLRLGLPMGSRQTNDEPSSEVEVAKPETAIGKLLMEMQNEIDELKAKLGKQLPEADEKLNTEPVQLKLL